MRALRHWACGLGMALFVSAALAAPLGRAQARVARAQGEYQTRLAGIERLADIGLLADADLLIERLDDADAQDRSAGAV